MFSHPWAQASMVCMLVVEYVLMFSFHKRSLGHIPPRKSMGGVISIPMREVEYTVLSIP